MMHFKQIAHYLLSTLLCYTFLMPLQAQTSASDKKKQQLQSEMKKLKDEIKEIESLLNTTSAKKKQSMSEVLSLQAKIRSREKLISNINSQIEDLQADISQTSQQIDSMQSVLGKMKNEYASMLRKSYQQRQMQNSLSVVFEANSLNEALLRYNYLLRAADFRRQQALAIQKATDTLQSTRQSLEMVMEKKEDLLSSQTQQVSRLENEKQEKDKMVDQLTEKEKKYRARQQEKQKAIQALNNKIQKIIEDEIASAKKKAATAAAKNNSSKSSAKTSDATPAEIPMTPEEQALSKDFAGNRGRLPWPVQRGHIVTEFGRHEHPTLKGVFVESNGVDIKTTTGSEARALFDGTVVSTFFLPTTQNSIIVKHGEYFTVYSGLKNVSVKSGQKVSVKQGLGSIFTDTEDDLTRVHLEIWRGKEKMDPRGWLASQ